MKRRNFLKGLLFSAMMPVAMAVGVVKVKLPEWAFTNIEYFTLHVPAGDWEGVYGIVAASETV